MKKPHVARMYEVTITRDDEYAQIAYKDTSIMTTNLKIGPAIADMTDEQILDAHNDCIRARAELVRTNPHVAVEVPLGQPQIRYSERADQWTPRGDVLRCIVEDGAEDGGATVLIDDKELTMEEFGRLLTTYAGWGMRIEFVPEDDVHRRPRLDVREPDGDVPE